MTYRMTVRSIVSLGAVLLGVAGAVTTSHAQQAAAPSEEAISLEEIVVTSQKRSESAQSVPISITAISGQTLNEANISVQTQLPLVTPGLTVNFNSDFVAPYIRGIGTEFANAGLDPSVGLYIDDQYYPRANGGVFSMADVERVEVLKGPQGTLYGRNTVGGAIRVLTNDPSQEFDAKSDITFGNIGRIAGDAMVNGAITDTLSGRLAFDIDTNTGYVTNNYNSSYPNMGNRHQYDIISKLLFKPTDRLSVHLNFYLFDKKDYEGEIFLPVTNKAPTQLGIALGGEGSTCFYCTPTDFFSNPTTKSHDTANISSFRVDYAFDGMTFSSISGYRHIAGLGFADLDTTSFNGENAASPVNTTSEYTQEFQFVSTLPGPWKYTGGVFLLHAREEYWFDVGGQLVFPSPPNASNQFLSGDGITTTDSAAFYGETTYTFAEKWDFTVGGRFTNETKDLVSNNLIVYLGSPNGADPQHILSNMQVDGGESILYRRFTPKAVISYRPEDKLMLYASFNRGFKSGGYNLPAFGKVDEVAPESVSAFEIGEKLELSKLRVNSAVFYDKQTDLQVQITDQKTGGTHVVNAGQTKIYGVETDIDWVPTEQWTFGLGAGWLHATYTEFVGAAYRACNVPLMNATPSQETQYIASCASQGGLGFALESNYNFEGSHLNLAPDFTGNIRAAYTLPLNANYGTFKAQVIESYSSSFTYNPEETLIESAKGLLTATLSWKSSDNHWRASIYGTNLTDKEYNTDLTYQNTGGWRVPGPPRQYGITVGAAWK